MKLAQLRDVKNLSNELDIDFRELTEQITDENDDFEIDNYRFIKVSEIDTIQQDELKSYLYSLGCFNADFIEDNTNIPYNAIVALQKADAYESLGEMMEDDIEIIQSEYVRMDGYGQHFGRYDGNEHETVLNNVEYYYFKIN